MRLERLDAAKNLQCGQWVLFQGRRNSGKSVLLRDCMHRMKDKIELLVAMSPTVSQQEAFRAMTPACLVHDRLDLTVIEALLTTQRDLLSQGKRARHVLLVLDDCSFDAKSWRSPVIGDVARNGRHANVTVFMTCQYACDISPSIRTQVDVIFALRDPSIQNRKRLWSCYFGLIDPVAKFNAIFESATDNYSALVLLNTVPSSDPSESVFWYKAKMDLPRFRMSNPVYFKLSKRKPPKHMKQKKSGVEICGGSVVSARG